MKKACKHSASAEALIVRVALRPESANPKLLDGDRVYFQISMNVRLHLLSARMVALATILPGSTSATVLTAATPDTNAKLVRV